jgi:hypothetical protein
MLGADEVVNPAEMPILVKHVMDRFPADAELVLKCALESERFRSLCEDYALALEASRRLESLERPIVERRIADYRALMSDLEQEIQRTLQTRRESQ